MKKLFIALFTLVISLFALTVCNKESDNKSLLALLMMGGGDYFTKTVALSSSPGDIAGPFNEAAFRHYQLLLLPADIAGSGNIKSLYFRFYNANDRVIKCPHVTIRLGHSDVDDLDLAGTDMAANINQGKGAAVTVLDDRTVKIPGGAAGDYFEIPLNGEFNYNGVDNLVVDLMRTSACTGEVNLGTGVASTGYDGLAYTGEAATPDTIDDISQSIHHMKFKFAGGDNTQNYGGAGTNTWPLASTSLRVQTLYLASNIQGSGPITGFAFQLNDVSVASGFTYSVILAHTSLSALTTTFANNYSDKPVTVANNVTFTVPAGIPAGEWIWVPIPDGKFTYNGKDNLIVEFATTSGTGGEESFRVATGAAGVRIWANGATATTGSLSVAVLHHAKFRFAGGTMDVITDDESATSLIFNTNASGAVGRLNLFRASELGTAGTITSIACRLNSASVDDSYANYQVIIGHSNVDALSATAADNFVDQTIAMNGTYAMHSGLLEGDWIEIPLSRHFAYDGKSNLAVWLGTTAGSGASNTRLCKISTASATRYPGQMAGGAPGAATVAPINYKFDMRFKILR